MAALVTLLLLLVAAVTGSTADTQAKPRNFVIALVDDLGG